MGVRHAKESQKTDGADATLVQPSDWNADHVQSAPGLLGRESGEGPTGIIPVGIGLSFVDGELQASGIAEAPEDGNSYARRNAAWVEIPRFLTYVKPENTTKTNDIVWADDPDLVSETLLPNAVYRLELLLMTQADAATDLAFRIARTGLSDATMHVAGDLDNAASTVFSWNSQQNIAGSGATAPRMGNYIGYIRTGANSGSVAIQWRQQASGAGASTLMASSMMMLRRVA